MVLDWDDLARLDAVLYAYFDAGSLFDFLPNQELQYLNGLCPIQSRVEHEVAEYYEPRGPNVGTVEVTFVTTGAV